MINGSIFCVFEKLGFMFINWGFFIKLDFLDQFSKFYVFEHLNALVSCTFESMNRA